MRYYNNSMIYTYLENRVVEIHIAFIVFVLDPVGGREVVVFIEPNLAVPVLRMEDAVSGECMDLCYVFSPLLSSTVQGRHLPGGVKRGKEGKGGLLG